MAALVKVLEVERVVPNLIDIGSSVIRFANLEFNREDDGAPEISATSRAAANAGDDELEEDGSIYPDEIRLQGGNDLLRRST